MATQSFEQLIAGANKIKTNELPESNTASLVGEQLIQMVNKQSEEHSERTAAISKEQSDRAAAIKAEQDARIKGTTEYNVSVQHPTGGISGSNKYTLETAIQKIPAELRTVGIKCSFIGEDGIDEEYQLIYPNPLSKDSWVNCYALLKSDMIPVTKGVYYKATGVLTEYEFSNLVLLHIPSTDCIFYGLWNYPKEGYALSFLDDNLKYLGSVTDCEEGSNITYKWVAGKNKPENSKYLAVHCQREHFFIRSKQSKESLICGLYQVLDNGIKNSSQLSKHSEQINSTNSRVKSIEDQLTSLNTIKSVLKNGKNLYNSKEDIRGVYINTTKGYLSEHEDSSTSGLIPVRPNTVYYIYRDDLSTGEIRFLEEDKETVLKPFYTSGSEASSFSFSISGPVLSPPTAAYAQFTVRFQNFMPEQIQFEEGSSFTGYEPFRAYVDYPHLPSDLKGLSTRVESLEEKKNTTEDVIDIASSDKIGFFSNSFLNGYCMLGKHAINNLSMFSDYIMYNFGHSGDDLLELLARVDANEKWLGDIPVQNWGIKYGVIAMQDNDGALYAASHDTYYENAKKLSNAIKAMGGIPILSTEHDNNKFYYALNRLAQDYKIMFMDWGKIAKSLFNTVFRPFWYNSHPATRTAWMWTYGMKPYFDSLPRPQKAIKLFRKRPDVDASNLQNLMYEDLITRAENFEEITCGVCALTEETDKFFDRISLNNTKYKEYKDEYQMIQNKTSVTFGDTALIEVVTPYDRNGCSALTAYIDSTGVQKAYIKKINSLQNPLPKQRFVAFGITSGTLSKGQTFEITGGVFNDNIKGSYVVEDVIGGIVVTTTSSAGKTTSGTDNPTTNIEGIILKGSYDYPSADYMKRYNKPLGEWLEIPFSTKMDLKSHLKTCMDFDKVAILLTGSAITISNVYFSVAGDKAKQVKKAPIISPKKGTSLLAKTTFNDNDTEWDGITNVVKYVPVKSTLDSQTESLPEGINTVRQLKKGQSIKQAISTSKIKDNGFDNVCLQVKIKARHFPNYIDNDEKWNASKIKRGSYDCANLIVKIALSADDKNGDIIANIPVGLWWNEFIINTHYFGGTHILIEAAGDDIQIAQCEVIQYD